MSSLASLFAVPRVVHSAPSSVEAIMGCSPIVENDANACYHAAVLCASSYQPLIT